MVRPLLGLLTFTLFFLGIGETIADFSIDDDETAPAPGLRLKPQAGLKQNGAAVGLAFAPDGKTLFAAGSSGSLGSWSPESGKLLRPVREFTFGLLSLAIAPDGKTLALGGADNHIHLRDVATDRETLRLSGHEDLVFAVAFSPDGRKLASASADQTVRVWDVATGKQLLRLDGHKNWVKAVAFSPDGARLVSGSLDQTARLWDLATGKELRQLDLYMDEVFALAFAPDNKTVALGGVFALQLWDTTAETQTRRLKGYGASVSTMAFAPDGRILATGSEDQTVRLWETVSGQLIAVLGGEKAAVVAVAFHPNGRTLAVGNTNGTVRTCDLFRTSDAPPATDDLPHLWTDLGGGALRAYLNMARLTVAPKEAVAFLGEQLRPVAPAGPQIDQWIADLDSARFADRQKATRELEALGELAEPALRKALDAKPSLETQRRLSDLLKPLGTLTPARLRALRGVQVLESIGTPEARQLLEKLAGGAPEALLTQEAKGALRRLGK